MTQLYVTPLPDSQATSADEGVRAQIQQSGLLQQGGTATEKIASEDIDLVVDGKFDFGAKFSRKIADEIESLGESEYAGVPLFTPNAPDSGRNSGYYEVEQVDVSPSHPVNQDAFEYTVGLKFTGTREEMWTSVETTIEDVETGLATGSNSPIGLPSTASKVRWFSESSGKENASVSSTVSAEFGDVYLYDPQDTSITNPILLYELDYADTGNVDVRVYDDRNLAKYYTVGGEEFSQWTHAYHTSYEYEGDPIVDNGLHRLRYDEADGLVLPQYYDSSAGQWTPQTVDHSNYSLVDAEFTKISPADVRTYCEFVDTDSGALYPVILSHQRGLSNPIARGPEGAGWPASFENYLNQFCSTNTTDTKPTRTLKAREAVK